MMICLMQRATWAKTIDTSLEIYCQMGHMATVTACQNILKHIFKNPSPAAGLSLKPLLIEHDKSDIMCLQHQKYTEFWVD